MRFDTKFPRFSKINVNGRNESPLYTWLKEQQPGRIKWNFTKFLIDRDGNVKARYAPSDKPEDIEKAIEDELAKQA